MTRPKRSPVIALLVASLLAGAFAAQAPAVTLMINGDTPSRRWQRVADRSFVATPLTVVTLRLEPCPGTWAEGIAAGCAVLTSAPMAIYMNTAPGFVPTPRVLMHELGHVFDFLYLTNRDRERFRALMGRPPLGWWEPLRPFDPTVPTIGIDGTMGEPSAAGEWFADVYQVCARIKLGRLQPWDARGLAYVPTGRTYRAALLVNRRVFASCRLIESIATRAGLR